MTIEGIRQQSDSRVILQIVLGTYASYDILYSEMSACPHCHGNFEKQGLRLVEEKFVCPSCGDWLFIENREHEIRIKVKEMPLRFLSGLKRTTNRRFL